jgi:hypothetical protein
LLSGRFRSRLLLPLQASGDVNPFEALEVRAFGCLNGELLERCHADRDSCLSSLKALHAA